MHDGANCVPTVPHAEPADGPPDIPSHPLTTARIRGSVSRSWKNVAFSSGSHGSSHMRYLRPCQAIAQR